MSTIAEVAQKESRKSDEHGKGAAGRLRVAVEMGRRLEAPAERIEQLAANFVGELERMDPGISYLLDRIEEEPDIREHEDTKQFVDGIRRLAETSEESLRQVDELADIVQGLGSISNRLRPVTRRMSTALRKIAGSSETMQEWGRRLRRLR